MLAHRHWITLKVSGKEICLCARCSGIVLGFSCFKAVFLFVSSTGFSMSIHILFPILFVLPAIIDWTTQTLGLRQSTNALRLMTGYLEGIGAGLLGVAAASNFVKLLVLTVGSLSIFGLSLLGSQLVPRTYRMNNRHRSAEPSVSI